MTTPHRLDVLTSLRFLAASAVLVAHLPAVQSDPQVAPAVKRVAAEGFAGVSFFFVLSGFVLAYSYHHRLARPGWRDLIQYYRARAARVWPLHLLCLGLVVASPVTVGATTGLAQLTANALLVHAWVPLIDFAQSYNSVSWSLSVEMFFYLTLPLVLGVAARRPGAGPVRLTGLAGGLWATVAVLVLVVGPSGGPRTQLLLGIGPLGRLPEFLVGVLLGLAFVRSGADDGPWQPRPVWTLVEAALVGGVAAAVVFSDRVPYLLRVNGYYTPAFALVVAVFARGRGGLSRLMAGRVMVYLGEISFALFLVHAIVFVHVGRWLGADGPALVQAVVMVGVALFAAVVLHHGFESPLRAWLVGTGHDRPCPGSWWARAVAQLLPVAGRDGSGNRPVPRASDRIVWVPASTSGRAQRVPVSDPLLPPPAPTPASSPR